MVMTKFGDTEEVHPFFGQHSGPEVGGKGKDGYTLLLELMIYHSELASYSWFENCEGA